jgi:putative ATP-binding cassette transporter
MFLRSSAGRKAKLLMSALLLLMLCINGMNVLNSFVGRYFMSAIEKRDMDGFVHYAWLYAGVFAASTLVAVFFRFTEERLGLYWREWMTKHIAHIYINRRVYLNIEKLGSITNPDQRISEDVRALTVTTLSFILMILNSTVTAISFCGVLWAISPMLFVVSVAYAAVGSWLTILLGKPLIQLNYRQADFEANFRSELIRVRENAEGIALAGHDKGTLDTLLTRVRDLVGNFRRIVSINRNVNFFTTGFNYMIQLIPVLFVAPIFIERGTDFGIIGQASMAFATIVGAFSIIVTQFQSISAYASVITRLGEFVEATEKATARDAASCIGCSGDSDQFIYRDLTLRSADERDVVLLKKLDVSFPAGKRVWVYGPNLQARFALFLASAGLYDAGSGSIRRPSAEQIAFLPEQPYLPPSTLHELLVPGNRQHHPTNEDLTKILHELGLGPALTKHDGLESPRNWHDLLSLGDQQLMAVARLIISGARFAFLDRLDSALTNDTLARVLSLLAERGVTCVSFGDGPPDRQQHDSSLEIHEDGSWEWTEKV